MAEIDPPFRTDPLMNIINIGLGSPCKFVLGGAQYNSSGDLVPSPVFLITEGGVMTAPIGSFVGPPDEVRLDKTHQIAVATNDGEIRRYIEDNSVLAFSNTDYRRMFTFEVDKLWILSGDFGTFRRLNASGTVDFSRAAPVTPFSFRTTCSDRQGSFYYLAGAELTKIVTIDDPDDDIEEWQITLTHPGHVTLGPDGNVWAGGAGPGGFGVKKYDKTDGTGLFSIVFPSISFTVATYVNTTDPPPTSDGTIPPLVGPPIPPGGLVSSIQNQADSVVDWDIDGKGGIVVARAPLFTGPLLWSEPTSTPNPTPPPLAFPGAVSTQTNYGVPMIVESYDKETGAKLWSHSVSSTGPGLMSCAGAQVCAGNNTVAVFSTWLHFNLFNGLIAVRYRLDGLNRKTGVSKWAKEGAATNLELPVTGTLPIEPNRFERTPR